MSFGAQQDAKEQVRQSINLVELVGGYLPLERRGRIYVALCPWHTDTRPSLQVNPERQSWKCWVCNVGGDLFSFVMRYERVEFREALEMLAERAGVQLESAGRRSQPGEPDDKRTLYEAMAWAEQQFRECLLQAPEADAARRYFEARGIEQDSCREFHLGYSPPSWQWLLDRARATKFSTEVLQAAGLAARSEKGRFYDRFRGRVMFPIRDAQSRTIAFGGRDLPLPGTSPGVKYINSPDTRLFSKHQQLYGLDLARDPISKTRTVVVVEGYTDVIMSHQFGLRNVVAVLGTALGANHIPLLRRYADRVILLLDGDEAGQRRTNEVLDLFIAGEVDLRIQTLPGGLDPCDFLLEHGGPALQALLDEAVDGFEHALRTRTAGIDLVRDTHRAHQALDSLLVMLAKSPRLTTGTSSAKMVRERQVLSRVAREFRVDESVLRSRIAELRRARPAARAHAPDETVRRPEALADLHAYEIELLEILVLAPDLVDSVLQEIEPNRLSSRAARSILSAYQAVAESGERAEFTRVLGALEDETLQSLFVEVDERATAKKELAQEDEGSRLAQLLRDFEFQQLQSQWRRQIASLEQTELSDEEELKLLRDLVDQQRRRQGIPAPTDG